MKREPAKQHLYASRRPSLRGELEGDQVTWPWHGAKFKVSTGEVLSQPAPQGVGSYRVWVNGPDIELEL